MCKKCVRSHATENRASVTDGIMELDTVYTAGINVIINMLINKYIYTNFDPDIRRDVGEKEHSLYSL